MNLKKNHERFLTKTLDTNVTSNDKSKSSIIITNPKKHFINNISYSMKQIEYYSHNLLKKKHNILPKQYNLIQLENFITGKYCRTLAKFKERLMFNYREEFIKKRYRIKEIKKKLPLFYEFYKSYLQFFCSPTFSDLKLNELIEKTVEKKAKAFYNEYYKNEKESKEKTMNIVIFTNKIRRDLSRKTDLANLSKTSIMNDTLTNKSSITTVNSIAKILFNEITSPYNISKNNNIANKNYFNNINNNSNIKKEALVLKKNASNTRNENPNYIKSNINLKDKIKLNISKMNSSYNKSKNKSNIIYSKNNKILTTPNHNTINSFSINSNYNTIEGNSKGQNFSIRKKTAVIKIKKNNNGLSTTNTKLNSNRTYKELKNNNSGCNINIFNKLGNSTASNIFKYNKNIIHKPKTRNYITGLGKNKSSFNYLNGNIVNQNSFDNISSNNNNFQSLNSLNTQSNGKGKVKKLLRIHRTNMNKNLNISSDKINLDNNNDEKNSNGKKIEECNKNSINTIKYRNYKIRKPYKIVSPYKKPESICGSTNILKGIKNNIGKINKTDNFKTIQIQSGVSNVKTNWSKKDKQIIYSQYNKNKKK